MDTMDEFVEKRSMAVFFGSATVLDYFSLHLLVKPLKSDTEVLPRKLLNVAIQFMANGTIVVALAYLLTEVNY